MTETIEQTKERAEQLCGRSDLTNEEIDSLNNAAWQLRFADMPMVTELSAQALQLTARNNYLRGRAFALRNFGWCQLLADQYQEAEHSHEESRQIFFQLQDGAGLASAINGLGTIKRQMGEYEAAFDAHSEALPLRQKLNEFDGVASVLINLGGVNLLLGDYMQSLESFYRGLQTALDCGSSIIQCHAYGNLGGVLWRIGEDEEAMRCSEQALALFKENLDRRNESSALYNLGAAYQNLREYNKALRNYQSALTIAQQVGNVETQAEAEIGIGSIYCEIGDAERSFSHLSDALQLSQSIGSRFYEGQALLQLGAAYSQIGNEQESAQPLERALEISQELNAKEILYKAHLALSRIYEKQNKAAAALHHYQQFHREWSEIYNFASSRQIARLLLSHKLDKQFKLPLSMSTSEPAQKSSKLNHSDLSPRKLQQVKEFIAHHLEENISGVEMAEVAGFNRDHFIRSFKQTTGKTPHQYLLGERVERAKELIKTTNLPFSEIALRCGFSDQSHLTVQFRLATGITPKQFSRSL